MGSADGVAAEAIKSRSGAASDPTGWIADPDLRSSVYPDVCPDIGVRHGIRASPEIWLGGAFGVANYATVSRRCADGRTGLTASARSSSRCLRQAQCYCRKANQSIQV